MYRFLTTRRWLIGHVVAVVLVSAFIAAGFWQLDRLSQRIERNQLIEQRAADPPVDLDLALDEILTGADPGGRLEYRRVTATGTYLPDLEVLVRSRSLNGEPGFHLVTPLLLGDMAVLVNRGWVPAALDQAPVMQAAPPEGMVVVAGRLRASVEPPTIGPKDPSEGTLHQVFWLNVERLQGQIPYPLAPVTLELVEQDPVSTRPLPVPLPEPVLDEGPHRGYAIQWFSFGVIGAAGYFFLVRRAARRPAETPIMTAPGPLPPPLGEGGETPPG
ncbi:MAG TPA: SURF1 family protein [Acidimicrobiia bacterium]